MHGLAIRRNTIQCMQAILEATVVLEIPLEAEAAAAATRVLRIDESSELSPAVVRVCTWAISVFRSGVRETNRGGLPSTSGHAHTLR